MGINYDVLLCSGETEDALQDMLKQFIGPQTVMHDVRPK
jgi:hypothetical protein